jgi:GR25 family glycosyltransferase involved in LPS biosynthesis
LIAYPILQNSKIAMKYHFYIVTVLESSERTANVNNVKQKLEAMGHSVEFIPAYYHKSCDIKNVLQQNGIAYDPATKYVHPAEIACFMSHREAWKKIADGNPDTVHIILEDDMNIDPRESLYDFHNAPAYDCILLWRHPQQMNTEVTYAGDGLLHYYHQWGSCAYAMTPTFSKELLTQITSMEGPVDAVLYGEIYPGKRVYIAEKNYFHNRGYIGGTVEYVHELDSLIWS